MFLGSGSSCFSADRLSSALMSYSRSSLSNRNYVDDYEPYSEKFRKMYSLSPEPVKSRLALPAPVDLGSSPISSPETSPSGYKPVIISRTQCSKVYLTSGHRQYRSSGQLRFCPISRFMF